MNEIFFIFSKKRMWFLPLKKMYFVYSWSIQKYVTRSVELCLLVIKGAWFIVLRFPDSFISQCFQRNASVSVPTFFGKVGMIVTLCILIVSIISCSSVTLTGNAYQNISVVISSEVAEDPQLIDSIKVSIIFSIHCWPVYSFSVVLGIVSSRIASIVRSYSKKGVLQPCDHRDPFFVEVPSKRETW